MKQPSTVPYDENRLDHQEPVYAISAWQQWNDIEGTDAASYEKDMADAEKWERLRHECQRGMAAQISST